MPVAGENLTVTRNEILTALNQPDAFVLAVVEVADGAAAPPRYVRKPFGREPDFGATSVTYRLAELLAPLGSPLPLQRNHPRGNSRMKRETAAKGNLQLEVADFGPIAKAKVDLRPLTCVVWGRAIRANPIWQFSFMRCIGFLGAVWHSEVGAEPFVGGNTHCPTRWMMPYGIWCGHVLPVGKGRPRTASSWCRLQLQHGSALSWMQLLKIWHGRWHAALA